MYLVGVFKLRLSYRQRLVLDLALREYADLRSWLLSLARQEIARLEREARVEGKGGRVLFPPRRLQSLLPRVQECPGSMHSGLKNAARLDVARMLSRYLDEKQRGEDPGYPLSTGGQDDGEYVSALERVAAAGNVSEDTWKELVTNLRRGGRARSLPVLQLPSMSGLSTQRGAALLVDPITHKYFALLYVLPKAHELGETVRAEGNLMPVGVKDADPFTGWSKTAIICPLEFGRWHRDKFLTSGAVPREGWVYRGKRGDYFLAVAFCMPVPEPVKLTGAVMAVVGSRSGFVAYTVVGPDGAILESGDYPAEADLLQSLRERWVRKRRRRQRRGQSTVGLTLSRFNKDVVHAVANDLVDKAVMYGARIVVQAPPKRKQSTVTRHSWDLLGRGIFPVARVQLVIEYKSQLSGLPAPRWVRTWLDGEGQDKWIHFGRICATCGWIMPKGEPEVLFSCPSCGPRDYALNLSMVVASSTYER
jgi:hypothetical protein